MTIVAVRTAASVRKLWRDIIRHACHASRRLLTQSRSPIRRELSPDHRRLVLQAAGRDAQIVSSRLRVLLKIPVGLPSGSRFGNAALDLDGFDRLPLDLDQLATAAASSGVKVPSQPL